MSASSCKLACEVHYLNTYTKFAAWRFNSSTWGRQAGAEEEIVQADNKPLPNERVFERLRCRMGLTGFVACETAEHGWVFFPSSVLLCVRL